MGKFDRTFWLLALAAACVQARAAEVDRVEMGTRLPNFDLLKPGTHHYLRYWKAGGANTPLDIWERAIRFEQHDGKPELHIVQRWDGAGPAYTRTLDSWFDIGTFRPHTHVRITDKDGKHLVEGFVFGPGRVTGMQDLPGNSQKDLSVASGEPAYNFETDIEFLQTLPLAEGYQASINFYHPGGTAPPQRYTWKVTGSQKLAGPAGPVDCWIVTTDYNQPGKVSTFWFAKGSQLMLRQESAVGDKVLVKTLID